MSIFNESADRGIMTVFDDLPKGWEHLFHEAEEELKTLHELHLKGVNILPRAKDVFNAFRTCEYPPKVVIFGQDPYHTVENGIPQACGYAFACRKGTKLQPSVKNIYEEIKREYPEFVIPDHGDISAWSSQGVLLLNTSLSVLEGKANSHKGKWKGFINKVIEDLIKHSHIVYLLWGGEAHKLENDLGERSIRLKSKHPSPLAVLNGRTNSDIPPFIGNDHFKLANEALVKRKIQPIDWTKI